MTSTAFTSSQRSQLLNLTGIDLAGKNVDFDSARSLLELLNSALRDPSRTEEAVSQVRMFSPAFCADQLRDRSSSVVDFGDLWALASDQGQGNQVVAVKTTSRNSQESTESFVGDPTQQILTARVTAGLTNFFLVGPAGCGKTTVAQMLGSRFDRPVTILSCNFGTSPADFTGYNYPEPRHSAISAALSKPGVIILDEIVTLDPAVAAVANSLLANNFLQSTMGRVDRHPECIIIATANTYGRAAHRRYVSSNQLDVATLDRFVGGFVEVDYNETYESQFEPRVYKTVWEWRKRAEANQLSVLLSTRMIITGSALLKAGIDWKSAMLSPMTAKEKEVLCG